MLYLENVTYKHFTADGYPIKHIPNGMAIYAPTAGHARARVHCMMRSGDYAIKFVVKSSTVYLKIGMQIIDLKQGLNTVSFSNPSENTTVFEFGSNFIGKNRFFVVSDLLISVKTNDILIQSATEFIPPKKVVPKTSPRITSPRSIDISKETINKADSVSVPRSLDISKEAINTKPASKEIIEEPVSFWDQFQDGSIKSTIDEPSLSIMQRKHVKPKCVPKKPKLRALIYIDVKGWCFDRIAAKIQQYFSHYYEFTVVTQTDALPDRFYDIVLKLWYGSPRFEDPFDKYVGAKKIVCFYDHFNWVEPCAFFNQAKKNIEQADLVGYSCQAIRDKLVELFGCTNLISVADGVDIKLFKPKEFKITDKIKVGWVGNPCYVKRYHEIEEALSKLDFVEFIPQTTDSKIPYCKMPEYYQSIDILVCFSLCEGTPNPILEAAASGRTFISTSVGIVGDLISKDEDCGFIIENTTQLCNRLKYLRNHITTLMEMGNKARAVVENHYDWESKIDSFGQILSANKSVTTERIITSTQYPRYGGAATCAYEMHRYLLDQGMNSTCIFFDSSNVNKTAYNPDNLPNVYYHTMPKGVNDVSTHNYLDLLSKVPDICADVYAFNYLAPIISKHLWPNSTIHYMITGCPYISNTNLITSKELLNTQLSLEFPKDPEATTVKVSDRIVPNTCLSKNIFEHIYRKRTEEPTDLHEIFDVCISPAEKTIDIIFVCSDLNRKVKGVDLVYKLFSHKLLSRYNKVVIGKNPARFTKLANVNALGLVSKEVVLEHMSKSKIILVPSIIESYSITAVEAIQGGCVVLSSCNAACSSFYSSFFVLQDYDLDSWLIKIKSILNNYDYFASVFVSNHQLAPPIERLLMPKRDSKRINFILFSIDLPYVGGCGTNSYNIITELSKDPKYNAYCIFITNLQGNHNPDNIPNVHRVEYDNKAYDRLCELRKKIPRPDIILCKNYKAMVFARIIYPETKIIYSPSGLRKVSSLVKTVPVTKLDIKPVTTPLVMRVFPSRDAVEFIDVNDTNLDDYAIRQADLVIPNSTLTHSIIDKTWPGIPNLSPPIYMTNINYCKTNTPIDRETDIVFVAYNWKRDCKNITLAEAIASHPSMTNRKIIIVGKSQPRTKRKNTVRVANMNKDGIFELFRNSKVLVIPSNLDSNPNVLIEAIQCGCNVVTSPNVGNSNNLHTDCVVTGNTVDDWIKVINNCLTKRYEYYGPTKHDILKELRTVATIRKAVGIYKIPPSYEKMLNKTRIHNIQFFPGNDDQFALDVVNNDIFYQLFVEIAYKEDCQIIDYILFDESIETNLFYSVHKYLPYVPKGVTIWRIKDMNSLTKFVNGDVYFLRGTYYQFFKEFVPSVAKSYFYPATSFKQTEDQPTTLLTDQKFSVLLQHSDSIYHKRYVADKVVIFDKFAPDSFICYNRRRPNHLCYVATDNQPTKNHHLFVHFVNWLDTKGKYNVVYVGDLDKLQTNSRTKLNNLQNVTLVNHNKLTKSQLIDLYNETKVNVIFSGRDACPRVVSESSACGCYNVSLDTVSDGKGFYDGILGELIGSNTVPKKLINGSLTYEPNEILWERIKKAMTRRYDYNLISERCKRKYNLRATIDKIFG